MNKDIRTNHPSIFTLITYLKEDERGSMVQVNRVCQGNFKKLCDTIESIYFLYC